MWGGVCHVGYALFGCSVCALDASAWGMEWGLELGIVLGVEVDVWMCCAHGVVLCVCDAEGVDGFVGCVAIALVWAVGGGGWP